MLIMKSSWMGMEFFLKSDYEGNSFSMEPHDFSRRLCGSGDYYLRKVI